MNIIFLSRYYHPDDINIWSGTLRHMYLKLQETHVVTCVGGGLVDQTFAYQRGNLPDKYFSAEKYAKVMGRLLSERIDRLEHDLIFFGDNYYVPYLRCKTPIVRISDVTFEQFKGYLELTDENKIEKMIETERLALNNYTHTIYSSEWIKQKTIDYYNIPPEKIDVVEFGANIPHPEDYQTNIDMSRCNLVFIGKNWKKKGGDKVLEAYQKLKADGFPCTLTIVGSVPDVSLSQDNDLTIIPFLDKSNPEDTNKIGQILYNSHFLVLPTQYDAYGIVFCEASAYGVPSIAADVCGVSQPVRDGVNGYLLPPEASSTDYAHKIKHVFNNKTAYTQLRASARREYETRLNWDIWGKRVNQIIASLVKKNPI